MPEWREINVNAGLLVALIVGTSIMVTAGVGFVGWDDTRNRAANQSFYDRTVKPRIDANERAINANRKKIELLVEKLETIDNRRNRQYGELKSNQQEIKEILADVRDLGIRK